MNEKQTVPPDQTIPPDELAAIHARQIQIYRRVIVVALVVIFAVLGQAILLPIIGIGQARYLRMMPTGDGVTYDFDDGAIFHSNDSRYFFFATRRGISLRDPSGAPVWHHPLIFTRPIFSSRGDYIAIGEVDRGRNVYVFDSDGLAFHSVFEHPVMSFSVNETGFLTAIVLYDTGYGVYVLNRHSPTATEEDSVLHARIVASHGLLMPVFAEASPNGRYFVSATVDLSMGLDSIVEFRYMNQRDAWNLEDFGLFGAVTYPGELVTAMRFMGNNRLIVATTARIVCFQVGPEHAHLRELWNITLQNALTHIEFFGDSHFAFVTGDRLIGEEEGDAPGTVRIVNINGIQTGVFPLGRRVTHFSMGHNAVLIGADRNFHAIDFRGVHLWEHTVLHDTRDFLFLEDTNTVLIAGTTSGDIWRRRRPRDGELEQQVQPHQVLPAIERIIE